MRNKRLEYLCLAGVLTALTFALTAYFHIPSHTGYVHIGDAVIYLAACILPAPYAIFVGAGGAVLADCISGYAIWAPASAIIKCAAVLLFSAKADRITASRNLLAAAFAGLITVGGYYLYEVLLTGSFASPLAAVPGNVTQAVLSGAVFAALGGALDRMHIKQTVQGGHIR